MRAALLCVSIALLAGCVFRDEQEAPPELSEDARELRDLGVGEDEEVVDDEGTGADESGDADASEDEELEPNPVPDTEDDEVPDEGSDEPELEAEGIGTLAVPPQGSHVSSTMNGRKWRCRQQTQRACRCLGSPLNCQMPNDQPGRNRYLPPGEVARIKQPGGDTETLIEAIGRWPAQPSPVLYDGKGRVRGAFVSNCHAWSGPTGPAFSRVDGVCAKINFGGKKMMKGEGDAAPRLYVYAFNVFIDGTLDSSGWMPLDSIVPRAELNRMRAVAPPKIKNAFVSTPYVVKSARDWNQDPATFSSDRLPAWAQAKVAKGPGSRRARDYLLRDGNLINLAFQTPGVGGAATDTFLVPHDGLAFRRVRSTRERPTLIRVPVAHPTHKAMIFAYGRMAGRYGWVAMAALKRGRVSARPACVPQETGTGGTVCR